LMRLITVSSRKKTIEMHDPILQMAAQNGVADYLSSTISVNRTKAPSVS